MNAHVLPLHQNEEADSEESQWVRQAQEGSKTALENLVFRHQEWIFNIALRLTSHPEDAEDITQEVLVKMITKLSQFKGEARFRTWLYRLVKNHFLDMKKSRVEKLVTNFETYGNELDSVTNQEPAKSMEASAEFKLLVEEAKLSCIHGMLLCLTREQRMIYILGCILAVKSDLAADIMEMTPANFRQKLRRARKDLHNFMNDQCGLINKDNPCRCRLKTMGFMDIGMVSADRILFNKDYVTKLDGLIKDAMPEIDAFSESGYPEIYRDSPMQNGPDLSSWLKETLESNPIEQVLH